MQTYEIIRQVAIRGDQSIREVAREYGISRRTVKKMVENPTPPGYRPYGQPIKPELGLFLTRIEELCAGHIEPGQSPSEGPNPFYNGDE